MTLTQTFLEHAYFHKTHALSQLTCTHFHTTNHLTHTGALTLEYPRPTTSVAGERFNGEVINADAMQLYRGLPIVTNVATLAERRDVPHHCLELVDPHLDAPYTVHEFLAKATAAVEDVCRRGKVPVVVGGTNYYIEALLFRDSLAVEESGTSPRGAAANPPHEPTPTEGRGEDDASGPTDPERAVTPRAVGCRRPDDG
jgi:hypothetical protein